MNQTKLPGRPVAKERHPLSTRTYRVATAAIEHCWQLVSKCLQYRIPGALIYGESRLGKTYAIEYLRMRKGKQICLQILEVLPSARMFCRQISPHS